MAQRSISHHDDIIDSRDIIERIEELEGEQSDLLGCAVGPEDLGDDARAEYLAWEDEHGAELDTLRKLAEEASGSPDWQYGEALIRDSYFEDYAQELAEDIGAVKRDASWPNNCIDWAQAARELKMDYFSVDFDGVEYWIRS